MDQNDPHVPVKWHQRPPATIATTLLVIRRLFSVWWFARYDADRFVLVMSYTGNGTLDLLRTLHPGNARGCAIFVFASVVC